VLLLITVNGFDELSPLILFLTLPLRNPANRLVRKRRLSQRVQSGLPIGGFQTVQVINDL
jgi:hypothetical protein